jgi:hypothetical protein
LAKNPGKQRLFRNHNRWEQVACYSLAIRLCPSALRNRTHRRKRQHDLLLVAVWTRRSVLLLRYLSNPNWYFWVERAAIEFPPAGADRSLTYTCCISSTLLAKDCI